MNAEIDVDKTFNVDIFKKNIDDFDNIINKMSIKEKRDMYNKVNSQNEILTYILKNKANELRNRNIGTIIPSVSLEEVIRHSIYDYGLYTIMEGTFNNKFAFDNFIEMMKDQFKSKAETLSEFSSESNTIYIYYNEKLDKIISINYIMYIKALIEYIKKEREFFEDNIVNHFEREVKKYLVRNNFK
ncbi:hypothetical protein [Staphylococcus phage vB_StaM_PB50]|nr:hypothetical protein [Staphylococcus phage vB_StaM_PB50]